MNRNRKWIWPNGVFGSALLLLATFGSQARAESMTQSAGQASTVQAPARGITLAEAVALAKQSALGSIVARGEVRVAEGTMAGAKASAIGNPYLDLQVDRGAATKDVQVLGYLYTPVDLFGQRGARMDEADALIQWRKSGLVQANALAAGQVVIAFGSLLLANERAVIAKRGSDSAKTEAEYFAARLAAQDATS